MPYAGEVREIDGKLFVWATAGGGAWRETTTTTPGETDGNAAPKDCQGDAGAAAPGASRCGEVTPGKCATCGHDGVWRDTTIDCNNDSDCQ